MSFDTLSSTRATQDLKVLFSHFQKRAVTTSISPTPPNSPTQIPAPVIDTPMSSPRTVENTSERKSSFCNVLPTSPNSPSPVSGSDSSIKQTSRSSHATFEASLDINTGISSSSFTLKRMKREFEKTKRSA
ncbi:hypothetical protein EJ08DRAFT_698993 [Tothia fuscella]|uniref:Uncharacterized protein n=1 Tax=Tothia fuscella TaxID=1048955 RepID=A0A9P4TXE5_9PEZI|nr:hypothetical protein EJ08DRAFT_698993 [Tothia fuscella]